MNGPQGVLQSTELLNPSTGAWSAGPAMPRAAYGFCAAQIDDRSSDATQGER